MSYSRRVLWTVVGALLISGQLWAAQRAADKKPSLSLKATPPAGFAPLRVHLVAELKGGSDNYAEFYCPTVQWDWDDGTISENHEDCDPYDEARSSINRRFTADHTFRNSGDYRLAFRLKQKDKVIAAVTTSVSIRAGANEGY